MHRGVGADLDCRGVVSLLFLELRECCGKANLKVRHVLCMLGLRH